MLTVECFYIVCFFVPGLLLENHSPNDTESLGHRTNHRNQRSSMCPPPSRKEGALRVVSDARTTWLSPSCGDTTASTRGHSRAALSMFPPDAGFLR